MQEVESLTQLGFIESEEERITSMWAPEPSGVYALDTKIGRTHADQCVNLMRRQDNPTILGRVVNEMVRRGRYEGVEVGFVHRVADHTMRHIEML